MAEPSIRNVKQSRKPRAVKAKPEQLPLVQEPAPCACPEENNSKLILAALRGIEESLSKLTEAVVAFAARPVAEKAPRAPRATKEEKESCVHALAFLELVPTNPKLARCTRCGAVIETPAEYMKQEVAKPAAEVVKLVGFESMRSAAIKFGTEKGKPALLAVMARYIPAWQEQKLASIPEAKRAAFVEEVSA